MHSKLSLIHEHSSPLFRIMSVYNSNEQGKRQFDNNICAFHIGNGYVLSIAHTLKVQAGFIKSLSDEMYKNEVLGKLDSNQAEAFSRFYKKNEVLNKWYISVYDGKSLQEIASALYSIKFDTRWQTLYEKGICRPMMILQFNDEAFYGDASLNEAFAGRHLYDTVAGKHTYLAEVELVKAYYEEDITIYKLKGLQEEVIAKIPVVDIDSSLLDIDSPLYCLQGSPANEAGRLLNAAQIEGLLDHTSLFTDPIGGNYSAKGLRYLVKGYFRFGSSGAPYLTYNKDRERYVANAIQSEASPLQLSIDNNREGNYQFVNAIACPLYNIKEELERLMTETE